MIFADFTGDQCASFVKDARQENVSSELHARADKVNTPS
jgi:hypothetical protein